ncbi:MAG: twin-arginine translocase TatA/TatE family subunit [Nitrospiraceae bacterium]|nr:twin-arginine translocase TatA/TatE family subunit [Nitrospiraceae bacterium]
MLGDLFQPMHLILILIIALLVFGPGKLPQIGAGLGKSIREFKKALSGTDEEVRKVADNTQTGDKQQETADK